MARFDCRCSEIAQDASVAFQAGWIHRLQVESLSTSKLNCHSQSSSAVLNTLEVKVRKNLSFKFLMRTQDLFIRIMLYV